jgi:hypothetical protein
MTSLRDDGAAMTELLARLVRALTDTPNELFAAASGGAGVDAVTVDRAVTSLTNLIRQSPLDHHERIQLLSDFDDAVPKLRAHRGGELVHAAAQLAGAPPRIPIAAGRRLQVPSRYGLNGAFEMLLALDESVRAPWTLIGGLMVLVHCMENDAPYTRPTDDADIAVNVFTHRNAIALLTRELRDAGFTDQTPPALPGDRQLSYRWVLDDVHVDVAVPPKANDQDDQPTAVTGRPAVELVATQQALRRTQRVAINVADRRGNLRRPDLLGAIVIKAAAAVADRRDPDRHRQDLVTLADILAFTGRHTEYAPQMRPKDRDRLRRAQGVIRQRQWRAARDPAAAQAAFQYLLGQVR